MSVTPFLWRRLEDHFVYLVGNLTQTLVVVSQQSMVTKSYNPAYPCCLLTRNSSLNASTPSKMRRKMLSGTKIVSLLSSETQVFFCCRKPSYRQSKYTFRYIQKKRTVRSVTLGVNTCCRDNLQLVEALKSQCDECRKTLN